MQYMPKSTMSAGSYVPYAGSTTSSFYPTLLQVLLAPFAAIKSIFTPVDDYWTWTTTDGRTFEDVVPVEVANEQVIIRHKYGKDTVRLAELNQRLRATLQRDLDRA
jgi:hypothetical protein